jgi:hypothetical protein
MWPSKNEKQLFPLLPFSDNNQQGKQIFWKKTLKDRDDVVAGKIFTIDGHPK